jgi:hypothetical protein
VKALLSSGNNNNNTKSSLVANSLILAKNDDWESSLDLALDQLRFGSSGEDLEVGRLFLVHVPDALHHVVVPKKKKNEREDSTMSSSLTEEWMQVQAARALLEKLNYDPSTRDESGLTALEALRSSQPWYVRWFFPDSELVKLLKETMAKRKKNE